MLKNKSFGTCKYNHAIMFDMLIIISCNLLKEQQKWLAEYLRERNFNPIDLVMIAKGVGFVESVNYLKRLSSTSLAHCDERRHALKEMLNCVSGEGCHDAKRAADHTGKRN
jgi:hypothetical protein